MKRELTCAMAQTLMPLSLDRLTDQESETALQEHLAACSACRAIYENTKADAGTTPLFADDKALFQKARKKIWRRIALTAVLCCAVCVSLWVASMWLNSDSVLRANEYSVLVEKVPEEAFLLVDAGGGDYLAHLKYAPWIDETRFHAPFLLCKEDFLKLKEQGYAYLVEFEATGRSQIDDISDCTVKDGKLQVVLWSHHDKTLFGHDRARSNDCMIYDDFTAVFNLADKKETSAVTWSVYSLTPGKDGG